MIGLQNKDTPQPGPVSIMNAPNPNPEWEVKISMLPAGKIVKLNRKGL
jgi:hypothetical protein